MLTKKEAPKNDVKTAKSTKTTPQNSCTIIDVNQKSTDNSKANGTSTKAAPAEKKNQQKKSKITIKYDVGFSNELFIRGHGADLKWDKGLKLVNVKADEWIWETNNNFAHCEFKVLLNDKVYENGENHHLNEGACVQYTPNFS